MFIHSSTFGKNTINHLLDDVIVTPPRKIKCDLNNKNKRSTDFDGKPTHRICNKKVDQEASNLDDSIEILKENENDITELPSTNISVKIRWRYHIHRFNTQTVEIIFRLIQ